MDGPHDLGGKEGFGPVDADEPERSFHHSWEGRMWGLSRSVGAPGVTIDWWRHVRELIDPVDYLQRPYFDSWAQTDFATFVNAGVISLDEVKTGKSLTPPDGPAKVHSAEKLIEADRASAYSYERKTSADPVFRPGDAVLAKAFTHRHHTRLPAYVRGRPGLIQAHHGAHVYPDESAQGRETAVHLYSVAFAARDLWPEAGERRDRVFLDLWETYLEPA